MREQRYRILFGNKKNSKYLLELYIKYKEECVNHLFLEESFVIHDKKSNIYFAVRDIIGFKPLYYTLVNQRIYFDNDIGRLFEISGINRELNHSTMEHIVYHSTIPYEETMYKNIKRVPPGHCMYVSADGTLSIHRYWKPEEIRIDHNITQQEANEKFLTLFEKAIFDRIDDLSTTGFELSGGLDSSSIVSMVRYKKPKDDITAFAMTFKSMKACDETEYIDAVQNKLQLDLHKIATDKIDYALDYNLEHTYKLSPYWPIFITYTMGFSVIERAEELGIKTILTGQGGDNVLAGNLYVLHEYFRTFKWFQLYREVKSLPNPKNFIKRYLLAPLLGEKNIHTLRYFYHKFRRKKPVPVRPEIGFKELSDNYKGNSYVFQYDLAQISHSTLSVLMESSYYYVAEKHFGIAFKHPFFDRRLIEFMLTLPPKFKYSEGLGKHLLRSAMKGILPEKIRQRDDKAEFTEVLRQQIDALDLDAILNNAYLVKLGLIEQERLDKYKNDYLSGKMQKVIYFWQLINLEYWYRYNFVDNREDERN